MKMYPRYDVFPLLVYATEGVNPKAPWVSVFFLFLFKSSLAWSAHSQLLILGRPPAELAGSAPGR